MLLDLGKGDLLLWGGERGPNLRCLGLLKSWLWRNLVLTGCELCHRWLLGYLGLCVYVGLVNSLLGSTGERLWSKALGLVLVENNRLLLVYHCGSVICDWLLIHIAGIYLAWSCILFLNDCVYVLLIPFLCNLSWNLLNIPWRRFFNDSLAFKKFWSSAWSGLGTNDFSWLNVCIQCLINIVRFCSVRNWGQIRKLQIFVIYAIGINPVFHIDSVFYIIWAHFIMV